jgi:hypothetical protein
VSPSLRLKTETDPVSETLCFLVIINQDDGLSPETERFCGLLIIVSQKEFYVCSIIYNFPNGITVLGTVL